MNERVFFRPAIIFLPPLILGIAAGTWFDGHSEWGISALMISLSLILHAIFKKRKLLITPLAFFLSLGYLSIQPWTSPSIPDQHISNFAAPYQWKITGTVSNDPVIIQNNRIRFVLMVESLQNGQEMPFPVAGKIRVTCAGNFLPDFQPGDRIRFPGKIRTIRNFNNPGGFDYERYMAFKTIRVTSYVSSDKVIFIEKVDDPDLTKWVSDFRQKIAGVIDNTHADEAASSIMKALIIGDRTKIDKDLRQAFNKSGMGHLLAISGLHVGIVASFFFLLFFRFFSLSRTFLDRAWVSKASALFCIIPVVMYGYVAGMSPSTQRAVIMISVFLITFLIRRTQDSMNTLAIAALVILIIYPPALFSISFQLSFSAVFSILFGFSRLKFPEKKFDTHLLIRKKISAFFFVSFFAIMGSLPLVMYHFNQVSLVGLFANFILVPIIGFLAVPLGLISAFVLPINQWLSSIGFQLGGSILTFGITMVHFFSNLSFSSIKTVTPSTLEIVLYYLLGGYFLHFLTEHPFKFKHIDKAKFSPTQSNNPQNTIGTNQLQAKYSDLFFSKPTTKKMAFINEWLSHKKHITIIGILILVTFADISYWLYARFFQRDLRINIVDVGQGNAAIIEFPGGKTMMIDGGGFHDNSSFDVGEMIIAPLLWRKKIKTVDTLILTHPDSDHLNGLLYIARHFNVKKVLTNDEPAQTLAYQQFMEIIHEKNIHKPDFSPVGSSFEINGVKVKILYPPEDFLARIIKESWRDPNSNSMVIRLEMDKFSCLFTGDIKAKSEAELVSLYDGDLKSLVLIAPHHGSKTSSTKRFIDKVNPETVIFSAGYNNRFKLPNEQVIKSYQQSNVQIFRTDYHGAVAIRTNGVSTRITPFLTP